MTFAKKYSDIKNLVSSEIGIIEKHISKMINLSEPLNGKILLFLNSHAKRIRLVLPVLFIKALGKDLTEKQVSALSAVEIVHNASLIHDDIIDESKTRRGLETVSETFGNKIGVIAGDYLLSLAMNILVKLNNNELLESFSKTLSKMCTGEITQNFNRFKIGTIEQYIEKTKDKTAYLFETAVLAPIVFDKTIDENTKDNAKSFALNTGIAFQIRDDLNNLKENETDKPTRNDLNDGIYNAPVIFAQSVENYSDGIEKTENLLNNYIDKAQSYLDILPDNDYKSALNKFLELLKDE